MNVPGASSHSSALRSLNTFLVIRTVAVDIGSTASVELMSAATFVPSRLTVVRVLNISRVDGATIQIIPRSVSASVEISPVNTLDVLLISGETV